MIDQEELNSPKDNDRNKEELICPGGITYKNCETLKDLIITPLQRVQMLEETIKQFKIIIPKAVA